MLSPLLFPSPREAKTKCPPMTKTPPKCKRVESLVRDPKTTPLMMLTSLKRVATTSKCKRARKVARVMMLMPTLLTRREDLLRMMLTPMIPTLRNPRVERREEKAREVAKVKAARVAKEREVERRVAKPPLKKKTSRR